MFLPRLFSRCAWLPLLLLVHTADAQVRLTEVLAVNQTGEQDEDGTPQPWLELWNPSATGKAVLTSFTLDNGSSSWAFPALEILPDDRVLVWLSGKNRSVSTSPLHTNFTLSASGGVLTLRSNFGAVVSRLNYPAQSADVSFGRDESDGAVTAALTGFLANPTPGERNGYSGPGVAGKVLISPASGAITAPITVTIAQVSPDPGVTIRYTTNGTLPNVNSSAYSGPITVSGTQIIRARAFHAGLLPGETESAAWLLVDAGSAGFSSPMPVVALTNFNGGTPPENGDQPGFLWLWEPSATDGLTHLLNPPALATRIAMDRRGSSTLGNPKFNLNVEFRKARDEDDRDLSLLGMPADSDWVFHAPYTYDLALIRNPLLHEMSNRIGRWASRVRMAEVFVDVGGGALTFTGGTSGDYFGVYNIIEKIRRGGDRLDIERLDPYDNDAVRRTGGYIFKIDRRDTDGDIGFAAGGFTTGSGDAERGTTYYYPNEKTIKTPQRDPQEVFLTDKVNAFYSAATGPSAADPVTGYAAHLDVSAAIDHFILNAWPCNVDGLRLSAYWHIPRGGKLIAGPVWDYDRCMDSADARDDVAATWRGTGTCTDFFHFTWWHYLFLDLEFHQRFVDRWQDLRRGPLAAAEVNALADALNAQLPAAAVNRDIARWSRSRRAWTSPFTGASFTGQTAEVQRIKDWMQQRANFFDSQMVAPVSASPAGGQVNSGTSVTLTGPSGASIFYTLDGTDPRPTGGGAPSRPGVFLYTAPIVVSGSVHLVARAYKATHTGLSGSTNQPTHVSKWSGQTLGDYFTETPASAENLIITEVAYHPADPTASEAAVNAAWGDNDFEFVELRNRSAAPVSLAGCRITSGISFEFSGANALTLPAGGHVIVAADPAAFAARYGVLPLVVGPFTGSLNNAGETVRLEQADGTLIQEFTYSDDWAPETDGAGKTLVPYNLRASGSAYTDPGNWRASAAHGGSPGNVEPNLAPEIQADADYSGTVGGIPLPVAAGDDGLPEIPGNLTLAWSRVSGPGDVDFSPPDAAASAAACTLPGRYVLRLSAADGEFTTGRDITVTAHDTFAAWLTRHPGIGPAEADADQDGLTNLTEFALLLDPQKADAALALSVVAAADGTPSILYRELKSPGAPLIELQVSADLQTFLTIAAPRTIVAEDDLTRTVRLTIPATGDTRRFLRFQISLP